MSLKKLTIEKNKDLTNLHTFGVPWSSSFFVSVQSNQQLREVLEMRGTKEVLVLGGGSNLLPTKKFKGLVIQNNIKGKKVLKEGKTFVDVEIGAGEDWHRFVLYAIRKGWYGLENLTLIPGTVGGAVVQNIGAYDVEVSRFVKTVETVNLETGATEHFDVTDLQYSYRFSRFKYSDSHMVTNVIFRLSKQFKPVLTYKPLVHLKNQKNLSAQDVSRTVSKIRKSKLPDWKRIGTAGSFFANPRVPEMVVTRLKKNFPDMPVFYNYGSTKATIPAGWLIEQSSLGPVDRIEFLYHKHALIVINNQKGQTMPANKGVRIKNFVKRVTRIVERDFGITLKPEVKIF